MNASETLPESTLLQRLAINDSGFVFDPVTGQSFTANESGAALLHLMMHNKSVPDIINQLTDQWNISPQQAERDLLEFSAELRKVLQG
jgi:fructose-1,6-bisphosphatase/inositol monophosphatase family enzyme